MNYLFSIEGNIGSGKSSLVKILKNKLKDIKNTRVIYLPEPVEVWESITDKDGKNAIEKYYENPEKYAFSFQMMAYISRIHQLRETLKDNTNVIIICERSVFTDKEIFAKMLYDDKKIDDIEYKIYCKWFYEFVKDIPVAGLIYVKTDPEICHNRVIKRKRKGEIIPLSYLQNCHKYHEDWLNNENLPILNLNGNCDFIDKLPDNWVKSINIFVDSLSPALHNFSWFSRSCDKKSK
jgi:deoxyadenosine/deoxycytidine kinase